MIYSIFYNSICVKKFTFKKNNASKIFVEQQVIEPPARLLRQHPPGFSGINLQEIIEIAFSISVGIA